MTEADERSTDAPLLRTERLLLRGWRAPDRDLFAALNADPRVMEHFTAPLTREQSDDLADRAIAALAERRYGLWAVEVPGVMPFIGFVGLIDQTFDAPFNPSVEVGWRLAADAWGHGYASEAARAVLAHGFGEIGLDEIVSMTTVGNVRSRAVMQRIGMTHDPADDFEHPRVPVGHPIRPHVLYRLSRERWAAGT